jgi:kinesin family protein 4/21/27
MLLVIDLSGLLLFFRCLLRDKEVDWREKDTEIRDLKEKVVKLTTLARHLEMQKAELFHQVKLQVSCLSITCS